MTQLRKKMLADLQAKNLPANKQEFFLEEISALTLHFNLSPDQLKPWQVSRYLDKCAQQMISEKVAALKFFYTEILAWEWNLEKRKPIPPKPSNPWSLDNPLRKRMREDLRLRNYAKKTQVEYDRWVGKFAIFHQASPETLGMEEVRSYLVHLVEVEKKAVGSCSIVSAALKFFFANTLQRDWAFKYVPTPRQREKPLPVIPSQQEMVRVISAAPGLKERVITMICYGAGLRPSEVAHLRPTDIDSQRMVIRVHRGKGSKDRYVMLSPHLLKELRLYWKAAKKSTA